MTDVIMKNAMYTIRERKIKDHRSNGVFSEVLSWLSHLKGIIGDEVPDRQTHFRRRLLCPF